MFKTAGNNATEGLVRHPLNWFANFKYCSYTSQELAKIYIVLMWPANQYGSLGSELFAKRKEPYLLFLFNIYSSKSKYSSLLIMKP